VWPHGGGFNKLNVESDIPAGVVEELTLRYLRLRGREVAFICGSDENGVPIEEIRKSAILSARALIEKDPAYSFVTARLLLNTIRIEILGEEVPQAQMNKRYAEYFPEFIKRGIAAERLAATSYARTRPVDRRHSEEAWSRNRRVEFVILRRTE